MNNYCAVSTSLHHYERQNYFDGIRAERVQALSEEWLKNTIRAGDLDELYCAVGDDLQYIVWEVGSKEVPFHDTLYTVLMERHGESIYDYVDAISDEEGLL